MSRNAFTAEDRVWLDAQDLATLRMEEERARAHITAFQEDLRVFGPAGDDLAYLNTIRARGRHIQALIAAKEPHHD